MNASNHSRVVAVAETTQSRCPTCYKKAPYHRKQCTFAAATIESAQVQQMHQAQRTSNPHAPPSYDAATVSNGNIPTVVAYESRYRPHGPIGFAVRGVVEAVQKKRDEKKFMREFEERRSVERASSSASDSSENSGRSRQITLIGDDGYAVGNEKRADII